jgi:hypothetical protein
MSHFTKKTSPLITISIAYVYVSLMAIILYTTGFYKNNKFFTWGTPVVFFGQTIESERTFYGLHVLIFFHQIVNNCVNSIVYAWLINSVQDPKTKTLEYSKPVSLIIVNMFNLYSEIDLVIIIGGFMSQISFVVTICLANIITSTYINNKYIDDKSAVNETLPLYQREIN